MDPISTALTAAWLDALRRAQSANIQRLQQIAPQTKPDYAERTLTDVIERGLKSGGAAPQQAQSVAQTGKIHKVDIRI